MLSLLTTIAITAQVIAPLVLRCFATIAHSSEYLRKYSIHIQISLEKALFAHTPTNLAFHDNERTTTPVLELCIGREMGTCRPGFSAWRNTPMTQTYSKGIKYKLCTEVC